jgi:gamma-tubulin complex component 2
MKHFFFLDQSEFLNQFLDTAGSELRKPVQSASMTKIQSLLYMAVSNPASASSLDPHKESLKVTFNKESLFDYLIRITSTATSANQLNELARGLGSGGTKREDNKSKKDLLGGRPFWKVLLGDRSMLISTLFPQPSTPCSLILTSSSRSISSSRARP